MTVRAGTGAVVVGCVLLAACGSSGTEHGDSPAGTLAGITVAAEARRRPAGGGTLVLVLALLALAAVIAVVSR